MNLTKSLYALLYDPLDQQVNFEGVLRTTSPSETNEVYSYLVDVHDQVDGILRLNFRRLRYINAAGINALSLFVRYAQVKDKLTLQVIASGVVAWSERVLPNLSKIWDKVEYSVYDHNFYKSQEIIEDGEFIPLLRNQTRIIWPLEKDILAKHGLERGMRVADICCGCGDVPLLICRELKPGFLLGVDHSKAAVEYARNSQKQFNINNADFQRGDATALMINDNNFDFVICRLSLQIFSEPELILKELIRITKPGGRIYTLCEDYDLVVGYPESDTIRETYRLSAEYGEKLGMDIRQGKKLFNMLSDARLEDIKVDYIMADTHNTDRDIFATMVESWRQFCVASLGESVELSQEDKDYLVAGYDAQLRTIRNPYGYTTWGMVACSGRKPMR